MRWRSWIVRRKPLTEFVDEQVRGPYRLWEHIHRFREEGDRTTVKDAVRHEPPFWPPGEVFHPLVRLHPERVFRYQRSAVRASLL